MQRLRTLVAAVLCFALSLGAGASLARAGEDWNVLLLTFDTTRADYIGCYGRENATTPNLDRLAAEGVMFEQNFGSNPVTQAAHSTILTGVYPMVHGVRDNTFFKLPPERETIAEILKGAGFATGAAIGGFPLVEDFGLAQGFDFYDDDITANREDFMGRPAARRGGTWYDERPAAHVNGAILPWLREHIDERFFVWLHYWDPHLPHTAPEPYGQLYAHDTYGGEIAYADQSLGTILAELKKAGVYERTLIIMTSDHGESMGEHREATHAFLAYNPTLRVPLIMRYPGLEGSRRVEQRVGTIDIVPTILDLVGVEGPPELQGRSLVELIEDPAKDKEEPPLYYSESLSPRLSHGFGELRALYDGPLKYIHGPRPELFDIYADPRELDNLIEKQPEEAARMKASLQTFIQEQASSEAAGAMHQVDDDMRAQLEALGYLDSTGGEDKSVEETLREDGEAPQDRVGDINLSQRLRQQIGAGAYSVAARTAAKLVEASPSNGFYRASLAQALIGLGKNEEAAVAVEEATDLGGGHQDLFLRVAKAVYDAGETARGQALAARILAAEETANAQLVVAEMALESGDAQTFLAGAEAALSLDENHTAALLALGDYYLSEKDLENAETQFRAALGVEPLSAPGQLGWAKLLAARGDSAQALARVQRLIRMSPNNCDARLEELRWLQADEKAAGEAKDAAIAKAYRDLKRNCDDDIREKAGVLMEEESN